MTSRDLLMGWLLLVFVFIALGIAGEMERHDQVTMRHPFSVASK